MSSTARRSVTSRRLTALMLLPLLLAGCGSAGMGAAGSETPSATTASETASEAATASSSEPTADAVPGMGRTTEPGEVLGAPLPALPSETANPADELCAAIAPEPLQDLIPALETIEAEPDYGNDGVAHYGCELSYPGEYIENTITDRGLDRKGYTMASGGFGVRMIVGEPDPAAELPDLQVPMLTTAEGRQVQAIENPAYGKDYIIKEYRVITDQQRFLNFIVAVFASDAGSMDELDQATMDSVDQVAARI